MKAFVILVGSGEWVAVCWALTRGQARAMLASACFQSWEEAMGDVRILRSPAADRVHSEPYLGLHHADLLAGGFQCEDPEADEPHYHVMHFEPSAAESILIGQQRKNQ